MQQVLKYFLALPLIMTTATSSVRAQPQTPAQLRAEMVHARLLEAEPSTTMDQQDQQEMADPWLAEDKVKHLVVGFLWTVGTQYALEDKFALSNRQALPFSVASGVAVSFSKEFYDWQYKTGLFSHRDLVADAIGIGAAAAFIWL